jgi:hypothetical protein
MVRPTKMCAKVATAIGSAVPSVGRNFLAGHPIFDHTRTLMASRYGVAFCGGVGQHPVNP